MDSPAVLPAPSTDPSPATLVALCAHGALGLVLWSPAIWLLAHYL